MPPAREIASRTRSPAGLIDILPGSVDVADHRNLGRRLADDGDDRLRFDRAILQFLDDVPLDGGGSAIQRAYLPGVGNGDVALGVDGLIGQRNEVAGPAARVDGNEQAARLGLEQGNLNRIADADLDLGHGTVPCAERAQQRTRSRILDQRQDDAIQIDERVVEDRPRRRGRQRHGRLRFDGAPRGPAVRNHRTSGQGQQASGQSRQAAEIVSHQPRRVRPICNPYVSYEQI